MSEDTKTFQDIIWNDIKNIDTEAFSLKNQPIYNWAKPILNTDPNVLTLLIKVPAIVSIIGNLFTKHTLYKSQNIKSCIIDGVVGTTIDIVSLNSNCKETPTMEENLIWKSILNIDLEVYSIPKQFVSKYFVPLFTSKENTILIYTSNFIAASLFKMKVPIGLKIISDIPFSYNQKSGTLIELGSNV